MSTLTAIVTSHANDRGLRWVLGSLMYQTRPIDETLVFVSGVSAGEFARLAEDFVFARFHREDDLQDWGHAKRAAGVERATGDYLGFFNDDDAYEPDYAEAMMQAAERTDADAVYCDWAPVATTGCEFRLGRSTSGNFIVRAELARRVGYPASAAYENDGVFIDAVAQAARAPIVHVPRCLYRHNAQ